MSRAMTGLLLATEWPLHQKIMCEVPSIISYNFRKCFFRETVFGYNQITKLSLDRVATPYFSHFDMQLFYFFQFVMLNQISYRFFLAAHRCHFFHLQYYEEMTRLQFLKDYSLKWPNQLCPRASPHHRERSYNFAAKNEKLVGP